MKLFNKKAGIKKLVLLTNMALMSFIMPTVANAESLTPTLGNNSAYTLTKVDSLLENTFANYIYNKTTNELEKEYWQWALKPDIVSSPQLNLKYDTVDEITSHFINLNIAITEMPLYEKTINSIIGDFINNSTTSNGAALRLSKFVINSINGDFVGNNASSGGAIFIQGISNINLNTINSITSNFINNYAQTENGYAYGGAIYNASNSIISNITGNFFNNYANGAYAYGGAISNERPRATINNITGDFIGNYASGSSKAYGGAIYNGNYGTIGDITGDFIGNYAQGSSASGGAIYNDYGTIDSITGDFIDNFAKSNSTSAYGGAIYNSSSNAKIGNITGDFIGNSAVLTGSDSAEGGAIFNNGAIETITGDFIGNYAKSTNRLTRGGAIVNLETITSITGDFIGNYAISSSSSSAQGGAIYNDYGTIGDITGDFIGNYAQGSTSALGGAILNYSTITSITGDFIDNFAKSNSGSAYGGAILNYGTITSISGDFNGNWAYSENNEAYGGAIYNAASGVINSIKGNFTENYVTSTGTYGDTSGGAIANEGTITSITGDFIRNKAFSNEDVWGIAIVNTGNIGTITGKFLENYGESKRITTTKISAGGIIYNEGNITTLSAEFKDNHLKAASIIHGGAIYNTGTIESITSDFINNKSEANNIAVGGAIYNKGTITSITGSFTSNKIEAKNKTFGGAIVNAKNIGSINATFNNNQIISENDFAKGGAIYNESTITSITGDFIGNYAQSTGSTAYGGAVHNSGTITSITGNFRNNYTKSTNSSAYGGAVYNSGTIETLTGDFINNYIQSTGSSVYGGAIANAGTINEIIGDFIGNYTKKASDNIYIATQGGAIRNSGTINSITGNFYQNYLHGDSGYAGAILGSSMGDITGDFVENYVISTSKNARGGAIGISGAFGKKDENSNVIGGIKGNFQGNWVKLIGNGDAMGGAIYVAAAGETGYIEGSFTENHALNESTENAMGGAIYNLGKIGKLVNSSFVGNWAEAKTGTALGGAIYTTTNMNLIADGKDVQIRDNYTMSNGVKDDNAIYVDNANATLTFNIKNNGSILLKDNIDGATGYKFNVTGDNTGMFYLQNDIRNANVSMGGITLNTINNQVFTNHFNSFTLTDTINMAVDVDLANGTMDRITADTYGEHTGTLNVIGMNLISDMASDVYTKNILFAEGSLKEQVTLSVNNLPDSNFQTTLLTPIYKYNVSYDKSGENGMFVFARPTAGGTGSTGNASDAFNPAILAGSTSAAVGAVGTVNQAVHHSFNNVDAYMNIPYMERMAMKRRNHYALAGVPDDVRQLGKYSPLYLPGDEEESVWVKPYTTFESVPLKNGPKVSNISYGTLVGFDSQMQSLRHGWDRVISGYVGYTGASQRYSGVDATQNGGILGGTVTLYKGNFFNATTLNVGSSVSQNETMYGKDDYTMLMSGIANKTGYNLEFKDGKVILQPSMLVGYTFVNTFDYTNAAGVKIDNKPLHTIQVSPGVKVIGNLKHGWQPYASVNMVWNLMGEYDATANGVKLPEMKVKPYVQYGVGLQKRVKDHFMAYGQAMLHNGGRNGISLTAGFRWALGHKDNCDYEIKEIKSDKKAVKVKTNKKAQTKANKTEIKVKNVKTQNENHFKVNKKYVSAK